MRYPPYGSGRAGFPCSVCLPRCAGPGLTWETPRDRAVPTRSFYRQRAHFGIEPNALHVTAQALTVSCVTDLLRGPLAGPSTTSSEAEGFSAPGLSPVCTVYTIRKGSALRSSPGFEPGLCKDSSLSA